MWKRAVYYERNTSDKQALGTTLCNELNKGWVLRTTDLPDLLLLLCMSVSRAGVTE